MGKFEFSRKDLIGHGAFAVVFKGRHKEVRIPAFPPAVSGFHLFIYFLVWAELGAARPGHRIPAGCGGYCQPGHRFGLGLFIVIYYCSPWSFFGSRRVSRQEPSRWLHLGAGRPSAACGVPTDPPKTRPHLQNKGEKNPHTVYERSSLVWLGFFFFFWCVSVKSSPSPPNFSRKRRNLLLVNKRKPIRQWIFHH